MALAEMGRGSGFDGVAGCWWGSELRQWPVLVVLAMVCVVVELMVVLVVLVLMVVVAVEVMVVPELLVVVMVRAMAVGGVVVMAGDVVVSCVKSRCNYHADCSRLTLCRMQTSICGW